jgi:CheY-like chemotaxis protein/AraC-like DNA-binding protein
MKFRFFTNVSHEFRTPLTLILTPLEKMLKQTTESDQKSQLWMMYRNARRLLNLVNQLLDFRKLEVEGITLHATQADVIGFSREIAFSFTDLSDKKHIRFSFQSAVDRLEMAFDQDKLEKILNNLLSNAFKFTPDGGAVSVALSVQADPGEAEEPSSWLQIQVKDTGIGIPAENQDQIFQRFFQSEIPGTMVNQGSGIGLALAQEFVKLHQGKISVKSSPEQGSCFTVLLPLDGHSQTGVPQVNAALPEQIERVGNPASLPVAPGPGKGAKKPVVLLIEDNEDFRFYLQDNLRSLYHIHEAANGKAGWQQVLLLMPDLVVSDIMMPEMDGIALCKKIKGDPRTSHIPVVLLTASVSEEQKLKGFETGANDYITKPFNFELLLSRIKNLVVQQAVFKKALVPKMDLKPQDISITNLDQKLIGKALEMVEKHLSNPDFSVEELSRELGMSRVYLYKKLLALTGKSPIEFIRTIRLKRAAQLLVESQLTVAEIAYEVGFNNPKYFTKYFKAEFHCLPSAYAAAKKESQISAD